MKITDNTAKHQFEAEVNGYIVRAEYILSSDKIILTHTEVPVELEGKGIGSVFLDEVFKEIDRKQLKLIPMCPFAAKYIKKHPEWNKILDNNVNIK